MTDYQILFRGRFAEEDVYWEEGISGRRIDSSLENKAKEEWEKIVKDADASGKKVWDGEVFRFENSEVVGGRLNIRVSTIPFSVRKAMNSLTNQIRQLGTEYAPMGMYSSIFVKTKDDKYVFMRNGDGYATDRRVSFVGGIISKSEGNIKQGRDLFRKVLTELKEEIGIAAKAILEEQLVAGYVNERLNFCLIFHIRLNKSWDEVKKHFKPTEEVKDIFALSEEEMKDYRQIFPRSDWAKLEIRELM